MFIDRNENGEIIAMYRLKQTQGQEELLEDSEEYQNYQLNILKQSKISEIKQESGNLINEKYPSYKQLNIIRDEAKTSTKYKEMQEFINSVRVKSDELESQINEMTDIEEISNFNVKNEFVL